MLTATPERLVVMLFDGAQSFLARSVAALRANEPALAMRNVQRAVAIIDELNFSLDMSYGEVPEQLRSIYLFHKRQLVQACVARDPEGIEAIAELLRELPTRSRRSRTAASRRHRRRRHRRRKRVNDPYERILELARREAELVEQNRLEELAAVWAERDELVSSLASRPPCAREAGRADRICARRHDRIARAATRRRSPCSSGRRATGSAARGDRARSRSRPTPAAVRAGTGGEPRPLGTPTRRGLGLPARLEGPNAPASPNPSIERLNSLPGRTITEASAGCGRKGKPTDGSSLRKEPASRSSTSPRTFCSRRCSARRRARPALANNIANANTPGYKRSTSTSTARWQQALGDGRSRRRRGRRPRLRRQARRHRRRRAPTAATSTPTSRWRASPRTRSTTRRSPRSRRRACTSSTP